MKQDLLNKIEEEAQFLTDKDPRRRFEAINRLTQIASQVELNEREKIVEHLGKVMDDPESFVRWNLAIALGKIAHPAGIKYLDKLGRSDEHANVRFRAALSLGLIGHESGVPILEDLAKDRYKIGEVDRVAKISKDALKLFPE